jgi:hypothetical protein
MKSKRTLLSLATMPSGYSMEISSRRENMRIARRFNAGNENPTRAVPKGRLNGHADESPGSGSFQFSLRNRASNFGKAISLAAFFLFVVHAAAEPDPNFHIYLCFGQSNLESGGRMNDADKEVDERFLVMADFDNAGRGWVKDHWYHAVPPLSAKGRGICMVDSFGRTLVAGLPENVRVGVIKVSVPGC